MPKNSGKGRKISFFTSWGPGIKSELQWVGLSPLRLAHGRGPRSSQACVPLRSLPLLDLRPHSWPWVPPCCTRTHRSSRLAQETSPSSGSGTSPLWGWGQRERNRGEAGKGPDPPSGVRGDEPSRIQRVDWGQELRQLVAGCVGEWAGGPVVRRGRVCGKHGLNLLRFSHFASEG